MDVFSLSPDEFLLAFQSASLPFEQWNHKAHLWMAYLIIVKNETDYTKAYQQIKEGINHFNSFHSAKLFVGYHETITRFWFEMVVNLLKKEQTVENFSSFLSTHHVLLQTSLLFEYYSRDLLFKEPKSRTEWVSPDLQPFPFEVTLYKKLEPFSK
eukprot:Phypoly_transcript_23974.p1 GENE.Phypoly_transcript_23974~~Phypoly_transcript_23974.p1  ORF type:complete len:155 (-),score=16.84 Phypoly_transcript_23974:85-549(-)